jgi:polyisoprenoid-binding protein YceI
MKQYLVFILCIVLSSMSLNAQSVWKADKAHSAVNFTVTHLLISEVTGRFTDFDVSLTQANDDFSGSTVDAKIKMTSINTDNEFRDKDLRSGNFFTADSFPAMTFKSSSFEKTGEGKYKITGMLTIRNVTKQVVMDAKLNGPITDPWGNTKVAFKATTSIDRFDYGLMWDKKLDSGGLVVSKEVDIVLAMEFAKQKPASEKK